MNSGHASGYAMLGALTHHAHGNFVNMHVTHVLTRYLRGGIGGCSMMPVEPTCTTRDTPTDSETMLLRTAHSRCRFPTTPHTLSCGLLPRRGTAVASMVVTVDGKLRKVVAAGEGGHRFETSGLLLAVPRARKPFCCPFPASGTTGCSSKLENGVENGR